MEKQCESCNEKFETKIQTKKYCSRKCYKHADYNRRKDIIALQWLENYSKNKELIKKKQLNYYHQNKETINKKRKEKYRDNSNPIKIKVNKYRLNNQEKIKKAKKTYNQNTKHIRNAKHNIRYKTDELYKLRFNMRTRLRKFLNDKGWRKDCHTSKLIGCTYEELKYHMEKQFTSKMSWKNHGTYWHIDHIIPLASAKCVKDLEQLCCHTNLQPLTIEENLSKGSRII